MSKTYYSVRVDNVCFTKHHQGQWSRFQILAWINSELNTYLYKIEDLGTGAIYCCLMEKLFPGIIDMPKVKCQANQEYEFLANFRLVQNAFDQVQVVVQIPMAELVKRRLSDNLEFGCWFRRLYERNYKKLVRHGYDPVAARGNQYIGLGPYRSPTKSEVQAMRSHRRSVRVFRNRDMVPLQDQLGSKIGEGDQLGVEGSAK
ncbi:hypothetical protein KR038_002269 [Drosophila bunnanda]|nr:hypothetical protein KR038_002269 [Drosophila bunnanda]